MQDYICSRCEYMGPKAKIKPGSTRAEIFWWLSFPIGPFYTAWRILCKRDGCPKCGETVMVPVRSRYDMLFGHQEDPLEMLGEKPAEAAPEAAEPPPAPRKNESETW